MLHPIDEDEPPRVLQLSLHRDVVELAAEELALARLEAGGPGELVEAGVDERAVELLVAVVQERDEVVDARPEKRVLEVDPADGTAGADHEVSRLVVAMYEAPSPPGDPLHEALGDPVERGPVRGGELAPARVEAPLTEVVDLPAKEVLVEGAAGDDRFGRELAEGLLGAGEVLDRTGVEPDSVLGPAEEEVGERVLAEILDHEPPARRVLGEEVRDVDATRREELAHLDEGPLGAGDDLLDLLGARPLGHEHRHRRLPIRKKEAEVTAGRSSPRHRFVLKWRPGRDPGDQLGERSKIDFRRRGSEADGRDQDS